MGAENALPRNPSQSVPEWFRDNTQCLLHVSFWAECTNEISLILSWAVRGLLVLHFGQGKSMRLVYGIQERASGLAL